MASSFLSATPPTPGKRTASEAFSMANILGNTSGESYRHLPSNVGHDDTEEDVDVDGDSSDEDNYEEGDEDDYVPKKLRLSKKHEA